MSVGHRLTGAVLVLIGLGVTVWASGSIRLGTAQEAAGGPSGMTAAEAITAHETATEGPAQPIPFNHRFHTTELQLQCRYCHTSTDRSQVASMPEMQVCMGCHLIAGSGLEPIDRLREMSRNKEAVQWERVYKLPEFVQFYHEPHLRNDIQCQECHGPVESMDRVYQYSSLRMGWCLDCHMQDGQATDVATDRLLFEAHPPPETPDRSEGPGLYPLRLDERYASSRGPIDCVACHY
ncbi:MAG: cytochrome c3 family protein [Gemmatimonadota bacterium]